MTILYCSWQENSTVDILETFQALGHTVTFWVHELNYYFSDTFQTKLKSELLSGYYDFIFTFNYFAPISEIAWKCDTRYVSWVYDCPHLDIYSTTLSNPCNYIFLFDKNMLTVAERNHAAHVHHLPLAVNTRRIAEQLQLSPDKEQFFPSKYLHDISFVGSLYEHGVYERLEYGPQHLRGYLHGIVAAQKKIWGTDLISQIITDDRAKELYQWFSVDPSEGYTYTAREIYSSMIQKKVTSEERIDAINLLSESFVLSLYTGSDSSLCPNAIPMGTTSYVSGMPDVFYRSKINLNITLRSITSGIPLRAIDILGCGGFLLSNYQQELCEYFIPEEDFIYFEDFSDMQQKAAYYLSHESERQEIAYNGYQKATQNFSYTAQVRRMLSMLE